MQNEEHHENVVGTGNIDSLSSGDFAYFILSQNVCRKRI
jgi:hypothetical protein